VRALHREAPERSDEDIREQVSGAPGGEGEWEAREERGEGRLCEGKRE
jgi:hypothetical protein